MDEHEGPRYATLAEQRQAWLADRAVQCAEHLDEPPPVPGGKDVWPTLLAEIQEQRTKGIAKYATPLQTFNGRSAKRDRLKEMIDGCAYLTQEILEDAVCDTALVDAWDMIGRGSLKAAQEILEDLLLLRNGQPQRYGRLRI